jgi:hypothetical protein
MKKFSHINEEAFLKSYAESIIKIRPYIIHRLCENYKTTSNKEEQEYLFVLAIEQVFLLYETLEGFFRAIKDRDEKSIFESLKKDLNIQNLYESFKNKTSQEILDKFNIPLHQFDGKVREDIEERFRKLAALWQDNNFYEAMRILIPLFNKLKHKLLIYKKNGRLCFVLEKSQEENFEERLQKLNIKEENNLPQNIDFLFDMAERFKVAILDLIAVRLLELS